MSAYGPAFGTRIRIAGLGVWQCHDRYLARLSDRFDVWRPTLRLALATTGYYAWEVVQ